MDIEQRILIVAENFYPEEFKINEVALNWKKQGYEIDVITQNPTYPLGEIYPNFNNKWFSKEVWEGINIYRVRAITGYKKSLFKKLLKYFSFMIMSSFFTLKKGKKYDYVFGFAVGALTSMVPAVLLKKIYNKKVTLWIQDIWPDSIYAYGFKKTKYLELILDAFVRFVYKNTSNFAISSEGFKGRILPYIKNDKIIEYSPNWADEFDEEYESFSFSEDKKTHFTFAGNVGKVQNLENIIESFGNLPSDDLEKAQLNIIGDGSELNNLIELVKKNNFKNIVFWGRKPRQEMLKYFQASDFLILSLINKPIFSVTVPAKTQTYIAVKKPILAILNGSAADIIKNNNLGYSSNPDNIEEIKNILKKAIYTDKTQIENFTKNCDYLTKTVFNKDNIISSLLLLKMK